MRTLKLLWWAFRYVFAVLKHKLFIFPAYRRAGVPWWFWKAIWHDLSKFHPSELVAYGFATYGPLSRIPANLRNGKFVVEEESHDVGVITNVVYAQNREKCTDEAPLGVFPEGQIDKAYAFRNFLVTWRTRYQHAWLRHQGRNRDHWEYWVARSNVMSPPDFASGSLPIPAKFIREIIGNLLASVRATEGQYDLGRWLASNVNCIILHQDTETEFKKILAEIYDPVWVETAFDLYHQEWPEIFEKIQEEYLLDPVAWLTARFPDNVKNSEISRVIEPSAVADADSFKRRLVRINDPDGLGPIVRVSAPIIIKRAIKDGGPNSIFIFYRYDIEADVLGSVGEPAPEASAAAGVTSEQLTKASTPVGELPPMENKENVVAEIKQLGNGTEETAPEKEEENETDESEQPPDGADSESGDTSGT